MARPLETEKRLDLALRATEVLQREGLEISMTRLAEALGIKRPTLLYHFPTRGHVVIAALEGILLEQSGFVMKRISEHDHPIDRLYARVTAIHEFHEGREDRIVFLTQALSTVGDERLKETIEVGNRVFAAHRKAQAELVRHGIARGLVKPCDVDALMALVRSLSDGLLLTRVMTGVPYAPVHRFLWQHVLEPLKTTPETTTSTNDGE